MKEEQNDIYYVMSESLNISRDALPQNKILYVIKNTIGWILSRRSTDHDSGGVQDK